MEGEIKQENTIDVASQEDSQRKKSIKFFTEAMIPLETHESKICKYGGIAIAVVVGVGLIYFVNKKLIKLY
jgi:hypothetical protein